MFAFGDLLIMPGGWPDVPDRLDAEARESWDHERYLILAKICRRDGHDEHVCAMCGDRSCLRCGLGLPPR